MGSTMNAGQRRNRNRGYMELRVWQDAIEFYRLTAEIFRALPYDLRRVTSQALASSDSIHRNIAEGYCRRSIHEYLNFLNYSLGSAGECVSGHHAYRVADQITTEQFERLDALAYKIENGLINLVASLEAKRDRPWSEDAVVRESNESYHA